MDKWIEYKTNFGEIYSSSHSLESNGFIGCMFLKTIEHLIVAEKGSISMLSEECCSNAI